MLSKDARQDRRFRAREAARLFVAMVVGIAALAGGLPSPYYHFISKEDWEKGWKKGWKTGRRGGRLAPISLCTTGAIHSYCHFGSTHRRLGERMEKGMEDRK